MHRTKKTEHKHEQTFGKAIDKSERLFYYCSCKRETAVLGTGIPIMHQLFSTKDHITKQIAIRHYYFTYFIQHCQSLGNYW